MSRGGRLAALGAVVLLGAACVEPIGRGEASAAGPVDLTVMAAASLREVIEAASQAYQAARPDTTITLATDSSAALATQIEQGAPADVFLSADTVTVARLRAGGHTRGEPIVFAGNELTVIVPRGNPADVSSAADLGRPGLTIVAAREDVPISRYAGRLLERLSAEPGYPADLTAAYTANVASREDSVAAVVAKVELGEADAAIVYATDAAASDSTDVIPLPDGAKVAVEHAGVVVATSARPGHAATFLEWLAGRDGQRLLERFGFRTVAR